VISTLQSTETSANCRRRRIVRTVVGSLGDIHPYIAIARRLQARGHQPVIAASARHRKKVEALGLGYRMIRPDSASVSDPDVMRRFMHMQRGLLRVGREWILPALRESYEDIQATSAGAHLLVSHPLAAYARRLVAEKTGIPWASTMSVPLGFFLVYDLGVPAAYGFRWKELRFLGPTFWRAFRWLGKRSTRFLARPWYRLRAEIGLPPTNEPNPLGDSHSPSLVLALFSTMLADRQPDWPAQTVITGFPLFDHDGEAGLPPALARFLDEGPPPIVFTLGTAVATVPGPFFEHSIAAAGLLGRRAVLILGNNPRNRPPSLPEGVVAFDYAPFSELFPRAAVIVHQGGIGTTGLAVDQISAAKAVCATCESLEACLEFALATNQESGVWGGTSEEERRVLRRAWLRRQKSQASSALL